VPSSGLPWLDTWAPAQFVTQPQIGNTQVGGGQVNTTTPSNVDTMLHWKIGGTVILALALVFILQQLGFRFVVAGSAGMGR
jgi:hypothetical protein